MAGVAKLLRLQNLLTIKSEKPRHYEETQVCEPVVILDNE